MGYAVGSKNNIVNIHSFELTKTVVFLYKYLDIRYAHLEKYMYRVGDRDRGKPAIIIHRKMRHFPDTMTATYFPGEPGDAHVNVFRFVPNLSA